MSEQTYEFHMEMTCGGCTGAAKKVLAKLGEESMKVETDLEKKTVTVTSSLGSEKLLEALKKTGKEITLKK